METQKQDDLCGGCDSFGEHLCYLVSQGFNISDEQEYVDLTVNAHFRCDHCGRQANRHESLCVPVHLQVVQVTSQSLDLGQRGLMRVRGEV
ncbi:MAG: hypothetical protein ACYTGS_21315 [Planctomycetota bacterium]